MKQINNYKNIQYPLRCSKKWLDQMKRKARSKEKKRGSRVTVADLIREACKSNYGVSDVRR